MSKHFSPGSSAASFVELVGNAAVVSGTTLGADVANLFVQPGAFPVGCLSSVLHESAHHYCFAMPVGHALSTCYLEAARTSLDDPPGAERDDHLAEAMIRYDFVTQMLRPLAEGIALYAEFDAAPGASPACMSPPLSDVLVLFSKEIVPFIHGDVATISDALNLFLFRERISGVTPARRQMVLMEPLIDSAEGYLTGYWLVKNWRLHMLGRLHTMALIDTDFYMQFIVNFIYGDQQLAHMILDFTNYRVRNLAGLEEGQEDFCTAFLNYFYQRLNYLLFDLTTADIDRVETALATGEGYAFDDVQIPKASRTATRSNQFDVTFLEYVEKFTHIKEAANGAVLVHLLNARRWIAYASFETSVRVDEQGRIWVGTGVHSGTDIPALRMPGQLPGVEAGTGQGVIELICDRNAGKEKFRRLVWRGTELVADLQKIFVSHADPDVPVAAQPAFSSASIRKIIRSIDQTLREQIAGMSVGSVVAEDCERQLETIRVEFYAPHVRAFVKGLKPGDVALRGPFTELCGNDIAALRIAAAIGALDGGIVSIDSGCWRIHSLETLLRCPLELAYQRGDIIYFRV